MRCFVLIIASYLLIIGFVGASVSWVLDAQASLKYSLTIGNILRYMFLMCLSFITGMAAKAGILFIRNAPDHAIIKVNNYSIALGSLLLLNYALSDSDKVYYFFIKISKDVMLFAVKVDGLALKYASNIIQNDREIVLAAVQSNGLALEYVGHAFQSDREIVLSALQSDGFALEYARDDLKADRAIVLAAILKDIMPLEYARDDLKEDDEILLFAAKQFPALIKSLNDHTKKDMIPELIEYFRIFPEKILVGAGKNLTMEQDLLVESRVANILFGATEEELYIKLRVLFKKLLLSRIYLDNINDIFSFIFPQCKFSNAPIVTSKHTNAELKTEPLRSGYFKQNLISNIMLFGKAKLLGQSVTTGLSYN